MAVELLSETTTVTRSENCARATAQVQDTDASKLHKSSTAPSAPSDPAQASLQEAFQIVQALPVVSKEDSALQKNLRVQHKLYQTLRGDEGC